MKTFTKYLVLLAISTSLLAMDDKNPDIFPPVDPFCSYDNGNSTSSTTHADIESDLDWFGLSESDMTSKTVDHAHDTHDESLSVDSVAEKSTLALLDAPSSDNPSPSPLIDGFDWLHFDKPTSSAASAAEPLSDETINAVDVPFEVDADGLPILPDPSDLLTLEGPLLSLYATSAELPAMTPSLEPARKARKKTSSAASASSSSAAASKATSTGIRGDESPDKYIAITPQLPCLWPSIPACHETFEKSDDLLKHTYQHHINKDYKHNSHHWPCPLPGCTHTAQYLSRLLNHMFTEKGIKPWQCTLCKKFFSNLQALRQHIRHHGPARPSSYTEKSTTCDPRFICNCGWETKDGTMWRAHVRKECKKRESFRCPCGTAFSGSESEINAQLASHIRTACPPNSGPCGRSKISGVFVCDKCQQAFRYKDWLARKTCKHLQETSPSSSSASASSSADTPPFGEK